MDIHGNSGDRDGFGNSTHRDAFGNQSNADIFGNTPSNAHGNYNPFVSNFASDTPDLGNASDDGGLLDALGEIIQGFFGLFGG
jgi:hypothetical protein